MNKFNTPKFKAQYILTLLIYTVMLALACLVTTALVESYEDTKATWDKENACIAELVATGIERRDIVRDKGSCYIK